MDALAPALPPRAALDRARLSRDPRFDGRFFVAVTSTGVYCRPICPAPSPRQAHVRYYPTAAAAAGAGYRPCLRCRPEAAPGTPAWIGTSAVVRRALALLHEGAMDEGSVEALAARVGIGPRQLHRLFVAHVGAAPLAVAQTRRLHFAKTLIDETDLPVTEVAFASGFRSLRRFNDAFRRAFSRPPTGLRRLRRTGAPTSPGAVALRLAFRPPYDLEAALAFLGARAIPGIERVEASAYARTIAAASGPAAVRLCGVPGRNELLLLVHGAPATALLAITSHARRVFDLGADPAAVAAVLRKDPLLAPLVRRRPGLRVPGAWDPFECAVRAILGQQVSVAAARTLAARLVERAGVSLERPIDGLSRVFPSPRALAGANLSGLGLTAARARTIAALARAVADGRLDLGGSPDAVRAALVEISGVGAWTAEYVALRALGEPDAFPTADLVLRRAAGGSRALAERELAARAEAWRPWRGYAAFHLWGAAPPRPRRRPSRRGSE
jgi:AraC family transcriptional regulator of adaptative response / DNA-3-methyladenine glycosylase II